MKNNLKKNYRNGIIQNFYVLRNDFETVKEY